MAVLQEIVVLGLLVLCMAASVSAHSRHSHYTPPPNVIRLTDVFSRVSIGREYSTFFGGSNTKLLNNGSVANLALDKSSGSGLASRNKYYYGFFSAAIKLPSGLSPGVVVAFYIITRTTMMRLISSFLGHDQRNDWVLQTNVYANGSTGTGREEKFYLWFDPTEQHHHYSIIWNSHHVVFLVDNIPVREFGHSSSYPSVYPSKPMSLYATIWDGSQWATHGGKYPVNYKYAPFVVSFAEMEMTGCVFNQTAIVTSCSMANPSSLDPVDGPEFVRLSKRTKLRQWIGQEGSSCSTPTVTIDQGSR
ncbi:hypothetical protein OIU84_016351 [Salix udensis]|uniref:GH16 domain-containing protein n=1 Tax=Salix udensis TaxID=889485 RepID=A0AAD6NQ32_9ROSI|nr:hypothetical protein OIU84_016351 [Salix udensis]